MTGLARAQDEVFSVQAFLRSRDAVDRILEELPIRDFYGHPSADPIARYPSFFYGPTVEELHKYLSWMITTSYNSTTGITTLRVQAFRPEDARAVASILLDLGEQIVNRMNARIQADAVRIAASEVKRNEDRLVEAQLAITRFRNAELIIDPAGSSIIITELIARLSAELAQTEAQIREYSAAAATNPVLSSLRRRAEALRAQIGHERQRISSDSEGLADKLATYERLALDREFAKQNLAAVVRSLETAQLEARRQQLYLERIVEPAAPDYPAAPERVRMIATAAGMNLVALLVGWLIWSGLREHAYVSERG
jgi:capsular polysaccharide transport system permease protein